MSETAQPILEIKNLEVVYHRAITAIQGISLSVRTGTITALIGTNGAGKTTTLSAIAGFTRAEDARITEGTIHFEGRRIDGVPNFRISGRGIGLVPEREKIFSIMTVEENLAACRPPKGETARITREELFALFPRIAERRDAMAGYLSGGERQMLALSMALLCGPRLLLIDEMSLGLAPVIVEQLQATVRTLRDRFGLSFLVVEQNAQTALDLADDGYVMESGRIVFGGSKDRLLAHADFQEFYLGMGRSGDEKSYRDVKQYRRKRRWFG